MREICRTAQALSRTISYPLKHVLPSPSRRQLPIKKRVRGRERAMTIGVGFVSRSGVVLAADTQYTLQGVYKFNERKMQLSIYPSCTLASTFANLPNLANVMNDRVHARLQRLKKSRGEAVVALIRDEARRLSREYPEEMAYQQFLWAVGTSEEPARLVRFSGGVVDEPRAACIGGGDSSLVRYLMSQTGRIPHTFWNLTDVVQFAAFIVQQAKQFVDGVGGATDIVTVTRHGEYNLLSRTASEGFEEDFKLFQRAQEMLYNIWTNSAVDEEGRSRLIHDLVGLIKTVRGKGW